MRAIQFRRNVRGEMTTSQSISRIFSVGSRRQKVSAQCKEKLRLAIVHCLNRMNCVQAMLPRRPKIKLLLQAVEETRCRLFPNSHSAIALHIAVTAHRTETGARLAHLSAQQHQV